MHFRTTIFLSLACAVCPAAFGQQLRRDTQAKDALSRAAIERRLQSKHPQVPQDSRTPVPGKYLLERSVAKSRQLRARIRAAGLSRHAPASQPGSTVFPGIQLRPSLTAGEMADSVAAGDFNNDGHMDFIVANGGTNDLWIYFGKGDGTFQLPQVIPLTKGLTPVYIVSADLRGTGTLDLIVAEFDTSTIGVLLGNGDGTFGYEQEYVLPQPPAAVVIDDFNHDGKLDIASVMVTVNNPTTLGVQYIATLLGDGAGAFGTPVITSNPGFYSTATSIASADINNDGLPDVLITGPGLENSQVYLNAGNGNFTPGAMITENGPFDILMAGRLVDVNEDGCPDAFVADLNGDVWTSLGDCNGNFAPVIGVPMGDDNSFVSLADISGDGHLDIVTTALPILPGFGDVAGNMLSVAFGDGRGNFSSGRNYVGTGMSYSLAIADFNGDGHPDIVSVSPDTDTATIYMNDGSGGFGFPQGEWIGLPGVGVLNAPVSAPSFADLNGDSKPDVLLLDEGYNGEYFIASLLNDGTGKFSAPLVSDTGVSIISQPMGDYRLGDFRHTGHLDFVGIGLGLDYSTGTQYILFAPGNGDGTFGKSTVIATPGANGTMGIGDFNGDGKLDIVAIGPPTNGGGWLLTTFLGNGGGTFRSGATLAFTDSAQLIGRLFVGDFNRDGKLDVLLFDTGNGYWTTASYVWEFLGNGDGTFGPAQQLFTAFQPMTMADVNGDSALDIVRYDFLWPDGMTETYGPAKFTTYLDQPSGAFSQSSSYVPYSAYPNVGIPTQGDPFIQFGDPMTSSKIADLNGDGHPDEIAFQSVGLADGDVYAQVLMGNGDGTFTPTFDVYDFQKNYFFPSYAHIFDGSTFSDLLEVDGATSSMHVFKGGAAPALQLVLEEAQVVGNAGCGWVFLNVPSTSDTIVSVFSSVPGVMVPASITVPAASLSQRFCYTLSSNFNWRQVYDVQAQVGGTTAIAYASQSYYYGFVEAISTASALVYPTQSTAPTTISLTSSQGYMSTVQLSCQDLPTGAACVFGSDSLSVSPAAVATTTLVIHTTAATLYGGPVQIIASDNNVTARQSFILNVQPLTVNSSTPLSTATSPGTASGGIQIVGIPPYTPSCTGLPAGVTCAFSGSQAPYPDTTNLALTLSVPSGMATGSYPFTVLVAGGPLTASQGLTLNVGDFSIGPPNAANSWAPPGGSVNTNFWVQSTYNLSGTTTATCGLDVGGTCTGATFDLLGVSSQFVPISLVVPNGAPPGPHTLTVTATNGMLTHSAALLFYVADYSGTLSSSSLTLAQGARGTVTATINATTGFAGTVLLACNAPAQIICTIPSVFVQPTPTGPQTATVVITASSLVSRNLIRDRKSDTFFLAALLFAGIVVGGVNRKPRGGLCLFLALFLPMAFASLSCGGTGGAGNGSSGQGSGGGVVSSSYSVTVTASAENTNTTRTVGTINVTVTR